MRFAASPLMVAVALGLLSPMVLDTEEDAQEDRGLSAEDATSDTAAADLAAEVED